MTITNEGLSNLDIKYHFLIDNILDVVGELDLNGIFTYVNPYIYDELGYQPNEIIGREIYEFVHPDDAKKITKVLLRRPKSHDFIPEIRLKNDKNQFIWYEIKARRIKDYNNQRKILITLKNISKVKLLEEKLEKKEENYQKITNSIPEIKFWKILTPSKYERAIRTTSEMLKVIIENIPQCVFWKDINFKYLGCNGNYSEFIGIEQPESIIGKTDEDLLFNREKIQQIRESETSVMLSGKPLYHTNESWIIEKGKDIWLDINKVPLIDAKGDVNGILVAFEEITDRKIAEEKLRNSEKKYKNLSIELETIMDIIPSMIFVKNLSGIYTRVNQIFADYLKLEKEDIIGKSTFDLFPQEVATNLTRDDLEVIKNGIPKLNIEETVEFPVGKVTENISKMPFYNEKDEINGVIGFAIDITERKELEQRLIKSEERYRELANSLPQVICEADERGNLTFVNNNAYSVFGYTPDDFNKGLNALQMLIPEDRKRAMENIKRVLRGKKEEKIEDNEYTALRKDGSTFPVIIYSSPIIYKNTSVGTRSIIIDITEKIKAKQRLKESEEKYRSIFEQGPDSIFLVDPETGEIFSFNERTYLNLGYSREEFSSLKISDFEIIDSPEEINKRIKKIINKGSDMFETKHITKEGEVKDILVSTNTIIIDGKKFIQSICRDITERKKAEIKLIESEEKYKYRYEFESLVSQLSLDFVNCSYEELDELINKALKQIAKFAKAVRTSLFICSDDLTRITNTNEWCANPKDSQINMLQDIPFETFGYYMKLLKEKRDVIISSLDDIPAEAKGERKWIEEHGFRSLLFVPIINNNKLYGTIGFYGEINAELEWSDDFINLLKIFANVFANTILHKQSEEKLNKSERKYSNLFQYSNDAIVLHNLDGTIVDANENALKWLGYTKSELLKMNISQLHPDNDLEISMSAIKDIKKNKYVNFEIRFKRKSGETFSADVSSKIIEIDDKTMIQGEIRDITERKMIEQKLKESEEKYRAIFEKGPDSIFILDPETGELLSFNERTYLNLGYSYEEFSSFKISDFEINESPEEVKKHINKIFIEGSDIFETKHVTKDGDVRDIVVSSNNIIIDGKKLIQSICRDITEHKKAEQNVKESEEKYKSLFEQFPMAILLVNFEGIIEDCNTSTKELFGYTKEELLGNDYLKFDIFPPDAKLILTRSFSKFLKTGEPEHIEIQMYRKDGKIVWIDSYPIIIKFAGSSHILAILRDITQRKTSEEKIRYQAKIIENMSEGLYLIKLDDGTIVYTNPAFEEMFGYEPGEMIGENVAIVNAPTDKTPKEKRNEIIETLKDTGEWHGEVLNAKKDGTPFWCYANVSVFDHPDHGSVIISIHTDITERKSKEEEARLHSEIMTNMSEGVYLVRWEDFIIVYANPRFEEMFGYEPGEMNGENVAIVNAPTDKTPEETKNEIVGLVRDTGEWHGEVINVKKDGTQFWCYANVSLFDHPEYGRVMVAVHTDITERKEIKEEWEKFFNLSLHILIIAGFDGTILRINPGWKEILGYDETNLLGHNFMDLVHPDDRETTKFEMEKLSKGFVTKQIENRYRSKDGSYRTLAWSAVPNLDKEIVYAIGYDVTDQKRVEREIIQSGKKLKNLIEAINIGITISNPAGELFEVNSHALEIFGYDSREEYLQTPAKNFYANPADRRQYIQLLESGPVKGFETKFKRKDGKLFWGSLTSIAKTLGNEVTLFNTVQDISQRKIDEKIIADLAKFPAENPNPVLRVSREFILYSNPAGENLFQATVGNRIPLALENYIRIAFNENRNLNSEVKLNSHIYSIFVTPIEGTEYANVYGMDITERSIAEQKLKESEERYRLLVETAVMGIVEFNVEENKVSYINPKLLEIVDYTKDELLVENAFLNIIHPDDYKTLLNTSDDGYIEFRIFAKDGKLKWLTGTVKNQFNQKGEAISARLWLQDSTETKEFEEIKSNLLTRFSHEFKTPLISITGFADLLLTEHEQKLDEKALSFMKRIKDGSSRLKILIDSFVESSQLDKAIIQVKLRKENLYDIIKDALDELEGAILMREHEINLNIGKQLITRLDKEKIHRVVINLLINAINYTPKGGKIAIHSKIEKKSIEISVKDTGIGLDKSELAKLFKPFGKIERYGKGWDIVGGGMGMGLFVSKEIIELHNGRIWAESEGRNEGTTFYFSIPKRK